MSVATVATAPAVLHEVSITIKSKCAACGAPITCTPMLSEPGEPLAIIGQFAWYHRATGTEACRA